MKRICLQCRTAWITWALATNIHFTAEMRESQLWNKTGDLLAEGDFYQSKPEIRRGLGGHGYMCQCEI